MQKLKLLHSVAGLPLPHAFNAYLLGIWASLVAQQVKNLPAMQETWVESLGFEDPLKEGMTTHSSVLASRIPMDRGAWSHRV